MTEAGGIQGGFGNGSAEQSRTANPPVRFYTVAEVAGMTSVSDDTIRREIKSGCLRAHRFRRQLRISERDFESWTSRSRYCPEHGVAMTYELATTTNEYRW